MLYVSRGRPPSGSEVLPRSDTSDSSPTRTNERPPAPRSAPQGRAFGARSRNYNCSARRAAVAAAVERPGDAGKVLYHRSSYRGPVDVADHPEAQDAARQRRLEPKGP